jgi:hypothetical protein
MGQYQFLDDCLDKGMEAYRLARSLLLVKQVQRQLGGAFRVSLALKLVALLLEERPDVLVVGDDPVVDDGELVLGIAAMRMRVDRRGLSVGSPARVRHSDVAVEGLAHVHLSLLRNEGAERGNLSHLFKQKNLGIVVSVTVHSQACKQT